MTTNRVLLCMKWGTLYSSEYVNVLYNAVRDQTSGPLRFVCLTDDVAGILPDIECHSIPDIGLEQQHFERGAWPKLSVFLQDLYGLSGRALFVDLDTIVCGDLSPFFDMKDELIALDSAPWRYTDAPPRTGTGIFAFDIGALGHLTDTIKTRRDHMVAVYQNEQDFVHGEMDEIAYWPQDWIVSYKYHLRPPLIIDRFRGPKPPSENVKIVVFHGKPRPIDLIRPPRGNWDVFPHYGKGPVAWMQAYWTKYGGKL